MEGRTVPFHEPDCCVTRGCIGHLGAESTGGGPLNIGSAIGSARDPGPHQSTDADYGRRADKGSLAPVCITAWHEPDSRARVPGNVLAIVKTGAEWVGASCQWPRVESRFQTRRKRIEV